MEGRIARKEHVASWAKYNAGGISCWEGKLRGRSNAMANPTLEQRVAALEQQVRELKAERANGRDQKPWLRVQGMFTGDEGMKEIFDEALKLRENDRQPARRRRTKKAVPRRANQCS